MLNNLSVIQKQAVSHNHTFEVWNVVSACSFLGEPGSHSSEKQAGQVKRIMQESATQITVQTDSPTEAIQKFTTK